jgi:hypothetical protein
MERELSLRVDVHTALTERWVPVMGGSLDVKWEGETDLLASYPISAKGAVLRLAHLVRRDKGQATSERVEAGKLEVTYRQGRYSTTMMLEVSSNQLIKAHQTLTNPIPAERWPLHVAVQVGTLQGFLPSSKRSPGQLSPATSYRHRTVSSLMIPRRRESLKNNVSNLAAESTTANRSRSGIGFLPPSLSRGHIDEQIIQKNSCFTFRPCHPEKSLAVIHLPLTDGLPLPVLQTLSEELRFLTDHAPRTPCQN